MRLRAGGGEAGRLADALPLARRRAPDLMVLDADLPDADAITAIEALRPVFRTLRIVVFASDRNPHQVRRAMASGADGYLLKSTTDAGFIAAIRDVAEGRPHVDPTLAAHVIHAQQADMGPLSPREREVMRLLARGHTNRELATMLFVSPRTAETHRRNIMHKLRLSSRAEMVRCDPDSVRTQEAPSAPPSG